MAIKLIANYSKRLGLPGYSSHQFSVSVETELNAAGDITAESERLYQLLQSNVDEQILHTGFVPPGSSTNCSRPTVAQTATATAIAATVPLMAGPTEGGPHDYRSP